MVILIINRVIVQLTRFVKLRKTRLFFVKVAAPVRRALQDKHIYSTKDLANYSKKEILSLHGIGKTSLPILRKVLKEKQLKFKSDE